MSLKVVLDVNILASALVSPLAVREYRGVRIVTAEEFLAELENE